MKTTPEILHEKIRCYAEFGVILPTFSAVLGLFWIIQKQISLYRRFMKNSPKTTPNNTKTTLRC
jgi:hypothetical protein